MRKTELSKLNAPRVVIADDHRTFSQILKLTLEEAGMDVIHIASTGREAVDVILKQKPDIVLMDIVMPEMDGLAALSIIKFTSPATPVFMITALEDPLYLARAGELGAEGYFSKTVSSGELIDAIDAILSRDKFLKQSESIPEPTSPSIVGFSVAQKGSQPSGQKDLTEQERMILSLIASGMDNQSVINRLHITKNTMKTHIRNIFIKLEVSDRTQAAIWAIQHGYSHREPIGY